MLKGGSKAPKPPGMSTLNIFRQMSRILRVEMQIKAVMTSVLRMLETPAYQRRFLWLGKVKALKMLKTFMIGATSTLILSTRAQTITAPAWSAKHSTRPAPTLPTSLLSYWVVSGSTSNASQGPSCAPWAKLQLAGKIGLSLCLWKLKSVRRKRRYERLWY